MININPGELQLLFCPSKALWLLRPTEGGEERGGQGRGEGGGRKESCAVKYQKYWVCGISLMDQWLRTTALQCRGHGFDPLSGN